MVEPSAHQDPIVLVIDFHHARLVCLRVPFHFSVFCSGCCCGFSHPRTHPF